MIVRKSGEKLLIFAFLISPAKTILCEKCFITRWGTSKFVKKKKNPLRVAFLTLFSLQSVSSGHKTLHLMLYLYITYKTTRKLS